MTSLRFILLIILTSTITSCTSYVTINRTIPARYHISGIDRVVFTPFTYETTYHEKGSEIIPEILSEALRKNGFFDVAETADVELTIDQKLSKSQIIKIGRRAKTNAVITGKVMAFQVTHETREIPVEEETPEGKKTYSELSIEKAAEVSFYADLVKTRTGERLDHKYFTRIGSEKAQGRDEIRRMSGDNKMLRGVTEKLAEKIVLAFTPHQVKQKIAFKSDKPCKDGIKLAKKGNWNEAEASWRTILSSEPNSSCATYNIGLYHEVKDEFPEALDMYKRALQLNPQDKLYLSAIKRTKNLIKGEKILEKQFKGRKDK